MKDENVRDLAFPSQRTDDSAAAAGADRTPGEHALAPQPMLTLASHYADFMWDEV